MRNKKKSLIRNMKKTLTGKLGYEVVSFGKTITLKKLHGESLLELENRLREEIIKRSE